MTNIKPIYLYIDKININYPGYYKILEQLLLYIPNSIMITNLDQRNHEDIILPLGVVSSLDLIKKNFPLNISFLIDAPSLTFLSIIKFYFKTGIYINRSILQMFPRYIKYIFIEKKIVKSFQKIIVVSNFDSKYLNKKIAGNKVITIPNGVTIPNIENNVKKEFNYTIGFLYYWGVDNSLLDIDWFIKDYLPKIKEKFPNFKIIAAGKSATPIVLKYFKDNNIQYLGEIDDLFHFYDKIDVYVTTVRKECGILNKVLDSFSYKKIVLALEHNMYAFKDLKNGYLTYNNVEQFIENLDYIKNNPELIEKITENAYEYIKDNHDWKKNYSQLYNHLLSFDLKNNKKPLKEIN